jgi:hypothetical protein
LNEGVVGLGLGFANILSDKDTVNDGSGDAGLTDISAGH